MQFFTRAWAMGEFSDEAYESVIENYQASIAALDEGDAVRRFATSVSLNDAWIDRVEFAANDIILMLLTGDLQRGYWHTKLIYQNARVTTGAEALELATKDRPTEIWQDEFVRIDAHMEHRFLLVAPGHSDDRGEVHVAFSGFAFSETAAAGRYLPPVGCA